LERRKLGGWEAERQILLATPVKWSPDFTGQADPRRLTRTGKEIKNNA
jgi:hypothetical protein